MTDTQPLPSEPGTFWLDRKANFWRVDADGCFEPDSDLSFISPEAYAPFRQLILK